MCASEFCLYGFPLLTAFCLCFAVSIHCSLLATVPPFTLLPRTRPVHDLPARVDGPCPRPPGRARPRSLGSWTGGPVRGPPTRGRAPSAVSRPVDGPRPQAPGSWTGPVRGPWTGPVRGLLAVDGPRPRSPGPWTSPVRGLPARGRVPSALSPTPHFKHVAL